MTEENIATARLAAWLMLCGGIVFWIGAGTPPYKQWLGSTPLLEKLQIIGTHRTGWYVIHACFLVGVTATALGFALFAAALRSEWAVLAAAAYGLGVVFWIVSIAFRLTVQFSAGEEVARTGVIPPGFEAWYRWAGLLFAIYMVLGYLAVAAQGGALLATALLPRWVGWTALVFGLVAAPMAWFPLFAPPLMVHTIPMLVGVMILLRR